MTVAIDKILQDMTRRLVAEFQLKVPTSANAPPLTPERNA